MVSIVYPTLPRSVDYNDIMRAATRGYEDGQNWKNERDWKNNIAPGFADSLYGQQQAPQTLSSLGNMFGQPEPSNAVQSAPMAAPMDPASARVEQAFAAQGQSGGLPSVGDMTKYIFQAAKARGIDPGIAIRVAKSEGLQPGTWQSNVMKNGAREPSYGPYQMLVGGGDTGFPSGMGNAFMEQTGLDPSDPANWQKSVDFALDTAAKQGWGQWYGAKAAGIGNMQGINGGGQASPSQQALESLAVGGSTPMPQAPGVQVADASGQSGYQPPNPSSILPPRDVMLQMLRNPVSRPLAINLAQSAQKMRANANDPMAQIEYQMAVEKLRQLRNPAPKAPSVVELFDEKTGQPYKATWNASTGQFDRVGGTKASSNGITIGADGSVQIGGPQKLTEGQSKDLVFYTRGIDAEQRLSQNDQVLADFGQKNAGLIPLGIGNYLRTPEYRQAKQAADGFLLAILRKDTGAAITDKEFEQYGPQFLPIPGDDPGTIAQKRRAREVALLAIRSGLGTAEAVAKANEITLGENAPNPGKRDQSGPQRVGSPEDYQKLPSGAIYIAPDGKARRKQ